NVTLTLRPRCARGHGAVVTGPSLPRVVGRTIFLALNATLQAQAINMGTPITYMDPEEARKIEEREGHGLARTWEGWKRKVMGKPQRGRPLYWNERCLYAVKR